MEEKHALFIFNVLYTIIVYYMMFQLTKASRKKEME